MQADFAHFLKEALAHFDRVIIYTSPILPVSDTLLLADKVQTVVLVVQSSKRRAKPWPAASNCSKMPTRPSPA